MIKAVGKTFDGTPMLIVGLTPEDLRELGTGLQITTAELDCEIGPDTVILLWAGQSDAELQRALTAQLLKAAMGSPDRGAADLRIHRPPPPPLAEQLDATRRRRASPGHEHEREA